MNELLYSPKIKPEHLARRPSSTCANRVKSKFDRISKVSDFSMSWRSEFVRSVGKRLN